MRACMRACVFVFVCEQVRMCACISVCMCVHMCVCVHACICNKYYKSTPTPIKAVDLCEHLPSFQKALSHDINKEIFYQIPHTFCFCCHLLLLTFKTSSFVRRLTSSLLRAQVERSVSILFSRFLACVCCRLHTYTITIERAMNIPSVTFKHLQ